MQEDLPHDPEQGIVRLEFLGGELLDAMRVKTTVASTCVRHPCAIETPATVYAKSRRQRPSPRRR